MKNLLSMEDVSPKEIYEIISRAQEIKKGDYNKFSSDKTIVNLFFETSTRTKSSFEMAEYKLGIHAIPFEVSQSAVQKGESLYDTCKTLEAIGADALVIRHPDVKYYEQLENINIPIINGGDGSGSHPSQSLLDMMTMYEHHGRIHGLKVVIVGDIIHSRVAKSNATALQKMGAEVYFSGPKEYQDDTIDVPYMELDEAVEVCDVVMMLRVQNERHDRKMSMTNEEYNEKYGINEKRVARMKDDAILMHPAPMNRGVEITDVCVEGDKSVIFEQMANGVFIRMSILEQLIQGDEERALKKSKVMAR
ncbi:aspartate carbamoyltransferase [Phocicoccus schoeneichii]|uniref:Aspartate carbamoyltransferase n=1 Tax=Phocicoccus schoeneichii TaxID=1812261 RepID=A0A6V7RDU9_9BACL|nr:aspartate carbamoyltransferase catalytic subunit [Jeotgalicoccus schoeneichii]GGH49657.1 aspartate carbamoyltransferase [Jeotgalicoccus schoeneichii]CAD2075962.1 Aspartate carbamoyltransferase [Jeotgalicoccus schoeneichii]